MRKPYTINVLVLIAAAAASLHLGLAYLQNGNTGEARSALQQVVKMNPSPQTAEEVRRALAAIQG
jgi:Tfp pilus assembly protein PilF